MAQDITHLDVISMLAVRLEYAFDWSGLPCSDRGLFKSPLISTLLSSLHYMDAWLPGFLGSKCEQGQEFDCVMDGPQSISPRVQRSPAYATGGTRATPIVAVATVTFSPTGIGMGSLGSP